VDVHALLYSMQSRKGPLEGADEFALRRALRADLDERAEQRPAAAQLIS